MVLSRMESLKKKKKQPQTTKASIGTTLQAPASNDGFCVHPMD